MTLFIFGSLENNDTPFLLSFVVTTSFSFPFIRPHQSIILHNCIVVIWYVSTLLEVMNNTLYIYTLLDILRYKMLHDLLRINRVIALIDQLNSNKNNEYSLGVQSGRRGYDVSGSQLC